MSLDINKIRNDFPILGEKIYEKPLIYLDNGATTQKPYTVIDTMEQIYKKQNSSIHRGIHYLSEQMTEAYEEARNTVRKFINALSTTEIIFTHGATSAINAVAFSMGEKYVNAGDEVVISEMEHHSNIVPWQMLCERKQAKLKVIPFNDNGELIMEEYEKLLTEKTRIVAVNYASNSLGTVNPVKEITRIAHEKNIPVLIDGAQIVQHGHVDVRDIDCDFFVFSGHKIFGPTGIGVLYGKEKMLEELPPYQGGGDMVDCVKMEKTTYNELPYKFEAGTMNYTGAIGLGKALEYVDSIGIDDIATYEHAMLEYTNKKLETVDGLTIYGNAPGKINVFSFLLKDIHPYDAGMILDKLGIAVRTGTHCTQPVMDHYNITGTIRASMVFYNTTEEVDMLVYALERVKKMFTR
ncbi:MAG: cysteine desulfurase [Bacteroidales bacterium]|nr:cysteine desulfurase [Bacteroidales bacterium]MDT8431772.1 cysteine desulfurase [Bacteroidales bacterium]